MGQMQRRNVPMGTIKYTSTLSFCKAVRVMCLCSTPQNSRYVKVDKLWGNVLFIIGLSKVTFTSYQMLLKYSSKSVWFYRFPSYLGTKFTAFMKLAHKYFPIWRPIQLRIVWYKSKDQWYININTHTIFKKERSNILLYYKWFNSKLLLEICYIMTDIHPFFCLINPWLWTPFGLTRVLYRHQ